MAPYQLQTIDLSLIDFNPRQPRSDAAATDLESLGASFGDNLGAPQLAQLPVVYPLGDGRYRVQMGERRVRSAQLRGVPTLQVLVLDKDVSLIERHRLSLLENLHRAELSVIDEAVGLKVAYFYENALALGLQQDADAIMEAAPDSFGVMQALQTLLEQNGWARTRPTVDWEVCLAKLGLALNKQALLRRLYVLNLDTTVIERILTLTRAGTLQLTSASVRVIGKLDVKDQIYLLDAIASTPDIANKIRRITSKVEDGVYNIKEAVAEARGEVYLGDDEDENIPRPEVTSPRSRTQVAIQEKEAQDNAGDDQRDEQGADQIDEENPAEYVPPPSPNRSAQLDTTAVVSDEDLDFSVEVGDQVLEAVSLIGQLEDALREIRRIAGPGPLDDIWGPVLGDSVKSAIPLLQQFMET